MICEVCGENAEEIRPNHYRCKYCTHEFDVVPESEKKQAAPAAPAAPEVPTNEKGARALSGEELYAHAIKGVVEVLATDKEKKSLSRASGFVVSEKGFILTNAHAVLDPNGNLCPYIQVRTQKGKVFNALPVALGKPADGQHDSVDLCLLYAEGMHVEPNDMGDVEALNNGQKVYLIGNSLGSGICITSGIISDKERAMPGLSYPYIMTDAAANPGNSGGPLYNEFGEVIGVLVAGVNGAKGMNYAIPSNVAEEFLKHVVNGSNMKRVDLSDLNKYASPTSNYALSVSVAFSGIRLVMDVIEYIIGLFKRK